MDLSATTVQLAVAGVLLVAATAKAAAPREVVATIVALGLPRPRVLHVLLVAIELVAAVVVMVAPSSIATLALVVGLGLTFALAGGWTWHMRIDVTCACFGGRSGRALGPRQVAALPLWIAGAAVPAVGHPLSGADGLGALTALAVAIGAVLAVPVLGQARRNGAMGAVAA